MGRNLSIHPSVAEDLAQIVAYIQWRDPDADAVAVYRTLRENFDRVAEAPFSLGSEYPVKIPKLKGIRKFVVPEYRRRYLIFYKEVEDEIQVLYVFQGMRDLPERMEEDVRECP